MMIEHRLVGYDHQTGRVAFEETIPNSLLDKAKIIAKVPSSDPGAAYDYELTLGQARDLAGFLSATIDTNKMDFFLEPFDLSRGSKSVA